LMSSMCSMPTETRMSSGLTPAATWAGAIISVCAEGPARSAVLGRQQHTHLLLDAQLLVGGCGRVNHQGLGIPDVGCKNKKRNPQHATTPPT
jgi:hypothetical protein